MKNVCIQTILGACFCLKVFILFAESLLISFSLRSHTCIITLTWQKLRIKSSHYCSYSYQVHSHSNITTVRLRKLLQKIYNKTSGLFLFFLFLVLYCLVLSQYYWPEALSAYTMTSCQMQMAVSPELGTPCSQVWGI